MTKYFLVGVAAFAMMTSAAVAQSTSSDTTTSTQSTTSTVAQPLGSYSQTKTQKTIDSSGVQTDKSQTYTSGINGTTAGSSTQTTAPDGSQLSTSHEERTASPRGDLTTTNHTTTTTKTGY
jgi:Flp pilus assembly protein TadD